MKELNRLTLPNGRIAYASKDGNIAIYGPDDLTFICSLSFDDVRFINMFIDLYQNPPKNDSDDSFTESGT